MFQMEYYDGNEFYFSATLLDKAPLNNPRLIPPAIYQVPLFAAFDFLRVQIEGKWSQNVSTSTGDVSFYEIFGMVIRFKFCDAKIFIENNIGRCGMSANETILHPSQNL